MASNKKTATLLFVTVFLVYLSSANMTVHVLLVPPVSADPQILDVVVDDEGNAEFSKKAKSVSPSYDVLGDPPTQNVTYRLLAVEQYFDGTPMKSAQWLIKNLTRYKNWQNVTWGGSKYTSYIHLLSYASIDSSLTQYYVGSPTNSNVVNEITNFLGQTGPGENNSLTIRILYYIGHSGKGFSAGMGNYHYMCLGTYNSHPSGPSKYQELYDYQLNITLNSGDLRTNNCTLIILDTCYSGGFINKLSRPGRVVLTAVNKNQVAWGWISSTPSPGYWGWFTGHENAQFKNASKLPVGIIGGITNAKDRNKDGWRSAGEVFSFADPTTQSYAKDNGKTMNPQSDYYVLGGGIPLVMYQPYITIRIGFIPPIILRYPRPFVPNAPPMKITIIPINPWETFRANSRNTGFSGAFGPGTSPLWVKSLTDPIWSSVAIHDGIVFAATLGGGGGGGAAMYALSWETGELLWKFTANSQIYSSPAVKDGAVTFGTYDGRIYALEEYTGVVRWMNYTYGGGPVVSSPAVEDDIVFVGSSDGYIQALNATTGWHIWSYFLGGSVDSSPAVADDMVFVGTTGAPGLPSLYVLNETTGQKIWDALTDNPVVSTPSVTDGLVFVGAMGNPPTSPPGIYAFSEFSGTPVWNYATPAAVSSSPAVDSSKQLVIVGCMNGYVYAFDEYTGPPVKWSYVTGGSIDWSSPAISSNGYVYVGSTDKNIYCLNETTGQKIWNYTTGDSIFSSPAITDDHLIIGSNDGNVYNFGPPLPVYDVAVLDVNVSPSIVSPGDIVNITYTVKNEGTIAQTFNVTIAHNSTEVWVPPLYYDTTSIAIEEITLEAGANTTRTYHWNTVGTPSGTYNISVRAQSLPDELDTLDNDFMDGDVYITGINDVAVVDVTPWKTIVGQGYSIRINVTVENQGNFTENFNVILYANTTTVGTQPVTSLAAGAKQVLTFSWNTTGFAKGNYTVSANATQVSGETDLADNTYTDGFVIVAMVGDVKGLDGWPDGQVNIRDIAAIARCFGSYVGHPRYVANYDLNDDGDINIRDIAAAARNYGKIDA